MMRLSGIPWLLPAALTLLLLGCGQRDRDRLALDPVRIDLTDTTQRRILELRWQRLGDSLLPYLSARSSTHRYLAAMAYGSLPSQAPIDSLSRLLADPHDRVRAAAAFALGQTGDPRAAPPLLRGFDQYDTAGTYALANRAILEAIGKCGDDQALRAMSTIRTYAPTDTALLEGQAWGLYRFGLRDLYRPEGTERALELVSDPDYPPRVRLIAAHYLYRSRGISIPEERFPALARAAIGDEDPRVRMALVEALGKVGSELALEALSNAFQLDPDPRVKVNVIAALRHVEYSDARDLVFDALEHESRPVAERAAAFFLEHGTARDGFIYYSRARSGLPWTVHIPLYAAVLRHLPTQYKDVRNAAISRLRRKLNDREASPFERAAALRALAEDPWNFEWLATNGFPAETAVVRAAAVDALALIHRSPKASANAFTRFLAPRLQSAIESGDHALMMGAAEILAEGARDYETYYDDLDWLESARRQARSGRQYALEAALTGALGALSGKPPGSAMPPVAPPPIDWARLDSAGSKPRIRLDTDAGAIDLELWPQETPGTVSQFLRSVETGYYDDTYFYRVVPNFVAQGALALDHQPETFRLSTESTPAHYLDAGLLGMASRGRHTEWTQFFLTHSPTPHLDGNYTRFGRVLDGMEVVNALTRGSRIRSARLLSEQTLN